MFPPQVYTDINDLLFFAIKEGVGKQVNKNGEPVGPWTVPQIVAAFEENETLKTVPDERTIQRWFQNNEHGIGSANIALLAAIFGCEDPNAIRLWRIALSDATQKLRKRKKEKYNISGTEPSKAKSNYITSPIARLSERIFDQKFSTNLPATIWFLFFILCIVSYGFGVNDITYSLKNGTEKQIGFLWAPNWLFEGILLVPMYLFIVTGLVSYWKTVGRRKLAINYSYDIQEANWRQQVNTSSHTFMVILLVSVLGIFLAQWFIGYYQILQRGNQENITIDWLLVALVRDDVTTIQNAKLLSLLAFLYSGYMYWLYFVGHVFLYLIASNFSELNEAQNLELDIEHQTRASSVSLYLITGIFRCTLIGILLALLAKLNATYLLTDAKNIVSWLVSDTLYVFGYTEDTFSFIEGRYLSNFTSAFHLFVVIAIYLVCLIRMQLPNQNQSLYYTSKSSEIEKYRKITQNLRKTKILQLCILISLCGTFFGIGQYTGFSIVLAAVFLISFLAFLKPTWTRKKP